MLDKKWNVVLANDHKLVCEAFGKAIALIPCIGRIHLANNGQQTIDLVSKNQIDLVLLDVRMPVMDGIQAGKHILKEYPLVRVISMTMYDSEDTLLTLLHMGVHGVLLKNSTEYSNIEKAIHQVMGGGKYYEEVQWLLDKQMTSLEGPSNNHFTPRELEVLHLTCKGKVAKEIADALNISTGTVENHRKEMLHKTKTKNVAELVSFVMLNGIVR